MRALLFESRTGAPVIDLEVTDWSCDSGILAPDKLSVTVPAYTPRASTMDLKDLLTPFKHSVALVDESVDGVRVVRAAGPIIAPPTAADDDGNNAYKVTCYGPERFFEYRHVRKYPGWPLIGGDGKPTGTYDMNLTGLEYGTIMKRLVAESMLWPGGDLPLVFEADRAGSRERTYEAVDGKPVLDALDDIADNEAGVEYAFIPEIDDLDNISWRFVTGTDAGQIISAGDYLWNIGGPLPDVRGFQRTPELTGLATETVFTGGKSNDQVLMARATSTALVDDGWPRVERWDSSHSTVSELSTLQGWANAGLGGVVDRISFEVRADQAHTVRPGDMVTLDALGHWDLPDGPHAGRVLSLAWNSSSPDWVEVQLV